MTCDLKVGLKQRLWRVSSACGRCGASSASSSRTPDTFRIFCCPSSVADRLTRNLSHRLRRFPPPPTDEALAPATLGTGTNRRAWRKLFWESQEMITKETDYSIALWITSLNTIFRNYILPSKENSCNLNTCCSLYNFTSEKEKL